MSLSIFLIHERCVKDWNFKFRHILRESNTVKTAVGNLKQVVIFEELPQHVLRMLEEDVSVSSAGVVNVDEYLLTLGVFYVYISNIYICIGKFQYLLIVWWKFYTTTQKFYF